MLAAAAVADEKSGAVSPGTGWPSPVDHGCVDRSRRRLRLSGEAGVGARRVARTAMPASTIGRPNASGSRLLGRLQFVKDDFIWLANVLGRVSECRTARSGAGLANAVSDFAVGGRLLGQKIGHE